MLARGAVMTSSPLQVAEVVAATSGEQLVLELPIGMVGIGPLHVDFLEDPLAGRREDFPAPSSPLLRAEIE